MVPYPLYNSYRPYSPYCLECDARTRKHHARNAHANYVFNALDRLADTGSIRFELPPVCAQSWATIGTRAGHYHTIPRNWYRQRDSYEFLGDKLLGVHITKLAREFRPLTWGPHCLTVATQAVTRNRFLAKLMKHKLHEENAPLPLDGPLHGKALADFYEAILGIYEDEVGYEAAGIYVRDQFREFVRVACDYVDQFYQKDQMNTRRKRQRSISPFVRRQRPRQSSYSAAVPTSGNASTDLTSNNMPYGVPATYSVQPPKCDFTFHASLPNRPALAVPAKAVIPSLPAARAQLPTQPLFASFQPAPAFAGSLAATLHNSQRLSVMWIGDENGSGRCQLQSTSKTTSSLSVGAAPKKRKFAASFSRTLRDTTNRPCSVFPEGDDTKADDIVLYYGEPESK